MEFDAITTSDTVPDLSRSSVSDRHQEEERRRCEWQQSKYETRREVIIMTILTEDRCDHQQIPARNWTVVVRDPHRFQQQWLSNWSQYTHSVEEEVAQDMTKKQQQQKSRWSEDLIAVSLFV